MIKKFDKFRQEVYGVVNISFSIPSGTGIEFGELITDYFKKIGMKRNKKNTGGWGDHGFVILPNDKVDDFVKFIESKGATGIEKEDY